MVVISARWAGLNVMRMRKSQTRVRLAFLSEMAFSCKNCLLVTYVIPLLLLAVLVFIATLVLGKNGDIYRYLGHL